MIFCKNRYRQLLRYSWQLKNEDKKFFDICESDALELLNYSGKMYEQLEWGSRDSCAKLMDDFLNGKISAGDLSCAFSEIQQIHERVHQMLESNLIILSPNSDSNSVSDLLDSLYWTLEDISVDSTLSLEELLSLIEENKYEEAQKKKERQIYNSVKEIYLEMQNFLNKDSSTFQNDKNFSKLVDYLSWETKDHYFELIEEFLDESSNFLTFKKKSDSVLKVAKELESNSIVLKTNYQALGFSNFIDILIQLFDRYQMDVEFRPKVFKSWVRKILLEMKNHYS